MSTSDAAIANKFRAGFRLWQDEFTAASYAAGITKLFESGDEAHQAMMSVLDEVMDDLRASGCPMPSEKTFIRDVMELRLFYQRWAKTES